MNSAGSRMRDRFILCFRRVRRGADCHCGSSFILPLHAFIMLRIAFCITELNVGGAERCLTELVSRLDRSRFEPSVFCLGPPPPEESALLTRKLEKSGVPRVF